jgi:hypothetical protein
MCVSSAAYRRATQADCMLSAVFKTCGLGNLNSDRGTQRQLVSHGELPMPVLQSETRKMIAHQKLGARTSLSFRNPTFGGPPPPPPPPHTHAIAICLTASRSYMSGQTMDRGTTVFKGRTVPRSDLHLIVIASSVQHDSGRLRGPLAQGHPTCAKRPCPSPLWARPQLPTQRAAHALFFVHRTLVKQPGMHALSGLTADT